MSRPTRVFIEAVECLLQMGHSHEDIAQQLGPDGSFVRLLSTDRLLRVPMRVARRARQLTKSSAQQFRRQEARRVLEAFRAQLRYTEVRIATLTGIAISTVNRIINENPDQAVGPKLLHKLRVAYRDAVVALIGDVSLPTVVDTANSRGVTRTPACLKRLASEVMLRDSEQTATVKFPKGVPAITFSAGIAWGIAADPSLKRETQLRLLLHELNDLRRRFETELDEIDTRRPRHARRRPRLLM